MDERKTRTWAEISLPALRHNIGEIRRAMPESCGLVGVVKADSYGHGAVPVAKTLREQGCRYLAVACPEEAFALRETGETLPILILGAVNAAYAPRLAAENVTAALECADKARAFSAALLPGQTLKIHVKLDTGMGRLGFPAADGDALRAAAEAMTLPGLEAEGVFTHFAVSDVPDGGEEYTHEQLRRFLAAADELERLSGKRFALRHCANSGAVLHHRDTEAAQMDLCRPGLLIYGLYPDSDRGGLELIPVMRLKTRVAAVTHHKKGDTISYGRTWTAERDTTLAVIPIGYADGLHRALSGKLTVQLRGQRAPQVGRICMDMCMLDVTELPEVQVGDEVTVFGDGAEGGPTAEELAELAGTISYELVCAVSRRVPRVYEE